MPDKSTNVVSAKSRWLRVLEIGFAIAIGLIGSTGCTETIQDPNRFLKICENPESGLTLLHSQDGFEYSMSYRPTEYFIAAASTGASRVEPETAKRIRSAYDSAFYFRYRVRVGESGNPGPGKFKSLEKMIRILEANQFTLSDRVFIVSGKSDTVRCSMLQIQPDWFSHNGFDAILAFRKTKSALEMADLRQLVLSDLGVEFSQVEFDLHLISQKYKLGT